MAEKPVNGVFTDTINKLQARIEALEKLGRQNHQDWITLDEKLFELTKHLIEDGTGDNELLMHIRYLVVQHIAPDPVLYHNDVTRPLKSSSLTLLNDVKRQNHEELSDTFDSWFARANGDEEERDMNKIMNRKRKYDDRDQS